MNTKVSNRAQDVIDIACEMAEKVAGWETRCRMEEIQLHHGYAEPGYTDPKCGIIATGNWNDITKWDKVTGNTLISNLPSRVCALLEKMGVEIEWSDEWCDCNDCGKLIRTSGYSYSWQPSYVVGDGELRCIECITSDVEAHLESLEGKSHLCNTLESIDPGEYGYVKVVDCETGFHPGQNDNPSKVAAEMRAKGVTRFLFNLDGNSQFDSKWSVWVYEGDSNCVEECTE